VPTGPDVLLQCVAVCCSAFLCVLQRVAACCSVLQRVAACCSVLQRVAVEITHRADRARRAITRGHLRRTLWREAKRVREQF